MGKLVYITVLMVSASLCSADPARLRNIKRVSARQQLEEDIPSQTPYPAAGIVPEVRFDLPTENVALDPENTYLPPDNVNPAPSKAYGPPDVSIEDDNDATTTEQAEESDEQEQQAQVIGNEAPDSEPESSQLERLVRRRPSNYRSAKLQVRPLTTFRSERLVTQPIRFVQQPIYLADGRIFAYNPQFLRV